MYLRHSDFLYQYLATVTGCLCIVSTGMHYGWPSPSLPILLSPDSPIPITNEEGSLVATIQEYGNVFGAVFAAAVVDKIGRKNTILISAPIFLIGWILIAEIESLAVLYGVRFSAGVVNGLIYTAVPMYLGEIAHPNIRGLLGSVLQISFVFGLLMYNILGSLVSLRVATYVAASVPLIQLVTFAFMPESPYYLVMKEKNKEAEKSLEKLNNNENMTNTLKEIVNFIQNDKTTEKRSKLELVTDKVNRKATFIIFGLRFLQQATGISAINFYVKKIFVDLDIGVSATMVSIIYFVLQFIMCFSISMIIDKTGRKPLMLVSFAGTALANLVLGVYFYFSQSIDFSTSFLKYIPVAAIFFYVVIFNVGLASTPMVLLSEMFNTRVKAVAVCFADIYYSVFIVVVSVFFQFTKDHFDIFVPFCTFSIFSLIGVVYVHYLVPETKGMTLEQIQERLRNTKKNREV